MSALNFLSSKTSFRLNIRKVGEFAFTHSTPAYKAILYVFGGVAANIGIIAFAVEKSERFGVLMSKVVDRYKSSSEESNHHSSTTQNGKAHDHVQPDADIPVREPV